MQIGVPKESAPNERRVALIPETVRRLVSAGHAITVEAGAGLQAGFPDEQFREAGATIAESAGDVVKNAALYVRVVAPSDSDITALPAGVVLICILNARTEPDLLQKLAEAKTTALAMELVPRIARAQRMDVLSSQASIAGYKGALIAAGAFGRYFPMMMTAAGTVPPAKVLVLGAGVAGLQAIATANRLGAVVEAFDVRPIVKEQVESLGATFIELPETEIQETTGGYATEQTEEQQARQQAMLAEHVAASDVVITTAAIPGRPAPKLIMAGMVAAMRAGSVIIDLASETGGNCELTRPGEVVTSENGVAIHGPLNVPSTVPNDASRLYSRNIYALLDLVIDEEGNLKLDFEDEIIGAMCVTHDGEVRLQP